MAKDRGKWRWHAPCIEEDMPLSRADAQLALMRAEIQRHGQSVVPCDRLLALVPDNDPIGAQFGHIFATAAREKWSFEFRADGSVRFASLDRSRDLTVRWPGEEASDAAEG